MISYDEQRQLVCRMAALNTFRLLHDKGYPLPDKPISHYDDSHEVLDYCLKTIFKSVEHTDELERKDEHGSTTVYESHCRFENIYNTVPPEVEKLINLVENCASDFHGEVWFSAEALMEDGKFAGITLVYDYDYAYPDYTCEEQIAILINIITLLNKGEVHDGCNNQTVG